MTIEHLPTNSLKEHPDNPRVIKTGKFKDLCESIRRNLDYFEARPILANKELVIFAGTMRWRAAQEIGLETVPVVVMDISDERQRELMVRDNVSSGEWDIQKLSLFAEPLLMNAGFTKLDLRSTFKIYNKDEDEDEVPEIPAEPKSKRGEVYKLGDHRLMCGDSTKADDVKILMQGREADMLFADPPYGVNYSKKAEHLGREGQSQIAGDGSVEEASAVYGEAFKRVSEILKDGSCYYVCAPQGGDQEMMMMMMMMRSTIPCRHQLIWKKDNAVFSMGRLDYDYQHEPILYGWRGSHVHRGGGRFKTSVWDIPRPKASKLHPTMKPVELVEEAILNSSNEGDIIFDPFMGSGTTLIAAQKTGRVCYGMEIDPAYCDVIRLRWQRYQDSINNSANQ